MVYISYFNMIVPVVKCYNITMYCISTDKILLYISNCLRKYPIYLQCSLNYR